ncbi:MAG: GNAT family N-acetyltransferase [Chloroflexota bacterium]|nr:GNAT family N-acetyltransferase [Chloroflexota bacterium]
MPSSASRADDPDSHRGEAAAPIAVRPFRENDRPFFRRIVGRLDPGPTAAPRDPAKVAAYFRRLAAGEIEPPPRLETFVAVDQHDVPLGLLALYPSRDYFTGHPRAYVETLVVAAEAEGRGVGRALMEHAEHWARSRGMAEASLDVFAGNDRARAFYERAGYRPDHVRMVKRIED